MNQRFEDHAGKAEQFLDPSLRLPAGSRVFDTPADMETISLHPLLEAYVDTIMARLRGMPLERQEQERTELRQHLAALAAASGELGASTEEAAREAIRTFGPSPLVANDLRRVWRRERSRQMPVLQVALRTVTVGIVTQLVLLAAAFCLLGWGFWEPDDSIQVSSGIPALLLGVFMGTLVAGHGSRGRFRYAGLGGLIGALALCGLWALTVGIAGVATHRLMPLPHDFLELTGISVYMTVQTVLCGRLIAQQREQRRKAHMQPRG